VQLTKSSLMLGLGETEAEVHQALADLRQHGVDVVTLGQYLQPSPKHLAVEAFIPPEQFATWQTLATETYGFVYCASGPLVRSSYKAGEVAMRGLLHLG
jgi:lipoic acid synthetase